MQIFPLLSDRIVLVELGARIAAKRIALDLSQAQASQRAGISKRTLERLEAGHSVQLSSLVRILRVLDGFSGLDQLFPEGRHGEPGPGRVRVRVSRTRNSAGGSA
ncbi:MAG: helix-turn-helix transcriptional regulator [Gammaproteobacteria bacterium]|nr:helix-turn-helix transcriptional regulator [Gammaproteobacteria bacterium]